MSVGSSRPAIKVIRPGDTSKPNPFTIVAVSNPALENPWQSGTFVVDPITWNQAAFDASVGYVERALFGALPGQAERFIADPAIAPNIRLVSLFVTGLPAVDSNSLVGLDRGSSIIIARRTVFAPLLARYALHADVAYAITSSPPDHTRASAWFTSDDDGRPGVSFTLDGVALSHRFYNLIPGTVALHATSSSLTALHEFGHALSSYSNGMVLDLYVDSGLGLNVRRGRPIPPTFGEYNGVTLASDTTRDSLSYPAVWQSYHCALIDPANPAVMDDYWQAPGGIPETCQHDEITRQFLMDRLRAKISRP